MKNNIYLLLLGLNIILTVCLFIFMNSMSTELMFGIVIYVALSTPVFGYLNSKKLKKGDQ